jgi:uncharacterized protein DUF5946
MAGNPETTHRCAGCGLEVAGGAGGCQKIMDEILALHFGDATYFGVHRLFVDSYALQHPERYCVSFKSLSAHLAHLCWSLEEGGSRAIPSEPIRRWVERHPDLPKPELPARRGAITIEHVAKAPDPEAHHRAVEEWARATWEAYAALHPLAREWVRSAFQGTPRRGDGARTGGGSP